MDRTTDYCDCMGDTLTHHRLVAQLAMHLQRQRDLFDQAPDVGE